MTNSTTDLKITYSDYHYLINLFEGEYDSDEIMTQSKIDYILNFSQSPTTATFFQQILKHSTLFIPNDNQIDNALSYLKNLIKNTTSVGDTQEINQVVKKFSKIQTIPMHQRPVYYRDSFNIMSAIDLSNALSAGGMTFNADLLDLNPVKYEDFMDELTNIPMQFS